MIDPTLPRVIVYGGGVAGLSAAHELAERGFKVHVVESRPHPLRPGACMVGGMAATQWSRFPSDPDTPAVPAGMRQARPPWELDWELNARPTDDAATRTRKAGLHHAAAEPHIAEVRFAHGNHDVTAAALNAAHLDVVSTYVRWYVETHVRGATVLSGLHDSPDAVPDPAPPAETLVVEGFCSRSEGTAVAQHRADAVAAELTRRLGDLAPQLRIVPRGLGCAPDDAHDDARARCVRFRIFEVRLPGEHGYRFFPAFYRHLFDVMKRTPIVRREPLSPEETARQPETGGTRWVPTGRTAYDNLLEADYHSIEQDDQKIGEVLPRRRPPSVVALLRIVQTVKKDLGFEWRDLVRSGIKILKYLTSHPDRRAAQYESMSWSQFMGIGAPGAYSATFEKALEIWPQALIGLRPTECDARTAGNATVQMLLDMALTSGFRDGTLNAPTSEAWLDLWQQHLESLGVEFHLGTLQELRWRGDDSGGIDVVHDVLGTPLAIDDAYVVIALAPEQASGLACELLRQADAAGVHHWAAGLDDLESLAQLLPLSLDRYRMGARPEGPFRHFNGIQYYLAHDFALLRGHTYYANAEWGLTSISQAQFRGTRPVGPYRGLISVTIGAWAEKRRHTPGDERVAWECTADEVAAEIWHQIRRGIDDPRSYFPWPLWYHFDEALQFGTPKVNLTPYMLSRPGEWQLRPGRDPIRTPLQDVEERVRYYAGFRYAVARGRPGIRGIVLAGNQMKTFTRLGTMESANESARHAVSAILQHWILSVMEPRRIPQWCSYWNVEDYELADLEPMKNLDAMLVARGLPHVVDILELETSLLGAGPASDADRTAVEDLLRLFVDPSALLRRFGVG